MNFTGNNDDGGTLTFELPKPKARVLVLMLPKCTHTAYTLYYGYKSQYVFLSSTTSIKGREEQLLPVQGCKSQHVNKLTARQGSATL